MALIERQGLAGTWSWNFAAGELHWSRGLFLLLGLDPVTVQPSVSVYQDLLHPEDRTDLSDPVGLFANGGPSDRRTRIIRPDGSLRWLWSISEVTYARDGTAFSVSGVTFDVTAEETLRGELNQFRALCDFLGQELRITTWSSSADGKSVISGRLGNSGPPPGVASPAAEWLSFVPAAGRDAAKIAWWAGVLSQRSFNIHFQSESEDGGLELNALHAAPVTDRAGRIERWVGIVQSGANASVHAATGGNGEADQISAAAIRGARAMLSWSAQDLASFAGISFSTVRRAEGEGTAELSQKSRVAIRNALERAGVTFGRDASLRVTVAIAGPTPS